MWRPLLAGSVAAQVYWAPSTPSWLSGGLTTRSNCTRSPQASGLFGSQPSLVIYCVHEPGWAAFSAYWKVMVWPDCSDVVGHAALTALKALKFAPGPHS